MPSASQLSTYTLQEKISAPKTKTMIQALERWGVSQEEHALLILNEISPNVQLSARNIEKLKLNAVNELQVYDVLRADKIVIEESAFKYIQEFYGPPTEAATSEAVSEQTDAEASASEESSPPEPAPEASASEAATA